MHMRWAPSTEVFGHCAFPLLGTCRPSVGTRRCQHQRPFFPCSRQLSFRCEYECRGLLIPCQDMFIFWMVSCTVCELWHVLAA